MEESGVRSLDGLDGYQQVDTALSAVIECLRKSPELQEYILVNLFHAELESGANNKEYNATIKSKVIPGHYQTSNGQYVTDAYGQYNWIPEQVEYKDVMLSGERVKIYKLTHIINTEGNYGNQFVPPSTCKSYHKELQRCSHCNTETHCAKQVSGKMGEIVWVCNSCLSNSDTPAWLKAGHGTHMCGSCHAENCNNHPFKNFSNIKTVPDNVLQLNGTTDTPF